MNKKWFIPILIFALAIALSGCGGGSGSSSAPPPVNAGVPSSIDLLPIQNIAQTNTTLFLKAKVLDGSGRAVPNETVYFTNLSLIGMLNSTAVKTDANGFATASLFSTAAGFSTVQAEVDTAAGRARDKKTVFFSSFDFTFPIGSQTLPTLKLEVDGNNNGIFNEPSDFVLFENANDNQVVVRATVELSGAPVVGTSVTFGADSQEASFPIGGTKLTDSNGQALTLVQVDPSTIRNFTTKLNITAVAANGAGNLITLFLEPVTIDTIIVSANPSIVEVNGQSDITASVRTTAGTVAPDGTIVNFSSSCGIVTPFDEIADGTATATFTAPGDAGNCVVTASVGGESSSTGITVIETPTDLSVLPPSQVIDGNTGGTARFTIFGGTAPYSIASNNPMFPASPSAVSASGGSFQVFVPANTPSTAVAYTVRDANGETATATVTVSGLAALSVLPATQSFNGTSGGTAVFTILGGKPPYLIVPDDPSFPPVPANVSASGGTFAVIIPAGTPANTVAYTIRDAVASTISATLNIEEQQGQPTDFFVTPDDVTISAGQSVTYVINGGTAPYTIFADRPGDVAIFPSGSSFTVVGLSPATVTIIVRDDTGRETSTVLTIQ